MHSYKNSAAHYDNSYEFKGTEDIDFYRQIAVELAHHGRIIEFGCGTGRVLLPIARDGFEIVGVDASEPMLSRLREKLANEPTEVQKRVNLVHGDMREPKLESGSTELVIIPFRALQHSHTAEDQAAAFASARQLLSPGGHLVFDVFNPRWERVSMGLDEEIAEFEWKAQQEGREVVVKRSFVKDDFNPMVPNFSGRFIFRTFDCGELIEEQEEEISMSCYHRTQLHLLLKMSDFEVVSEFGQFDRSPLKPVATEMIFVAKAK